MPAKIGVWQIRLMAYDRGENETDESFDKRNEVQVNALLDRMGEIEAFVNEDLDEGFYVKIEG